MKVLYYNWTPINGQGGGVAIYVRNLLEYVGTSKKKLNIEPYFLSSGYYYDNTKKRKLYIKREKDFCGVPVFSMVNSPVVAPAAYAVSSFHEMKVDKTQIKVFREFIASIGGVDVIHFQSFEGLSFNILKIKKYFLDTVIVHTAHDYGTICSKVRLWNYKQENCLKSVEKDKCLYCHKNKKFGLTEDNVLARISSLYGIDVPYNDISKNVRVVRIIRRIISGMRFHRIYSNNRYRDYNVSKINKYSNLEIAVSKRVAEILVAHGINKDKVRVDYIGTKIADQCLYKCKTDSRTEVFTILYMGYSGIDKGFFSFLNALETMSGDVCKNVVVKVASKMTLEQQNRLATLKDRYKNIMVFNGYSCEDFSEIMRNVNLGVVPPLWEDNFPQVAIEMVANGIPVITSMNGGAHELNSNEDFRFENPDDLSGKIENIFKNRNLLDEYWDTVMQLTTMQMHVDNLMLLYQMVCNVDQIDPSE